MYNCEVPYSGEPNRTCTFMPDLEGIKNDINIARKLSRKTNAVYGLAIINITMVNGKVTKMVLIYIHYKL